MSQVRDLFFDEFYTELERVATEIEGKEKAEVERPLLFHEVREKWTPYTHNQDNRKEPVISVDGGVQESHFAYGDYVSVARACALIHWPGKDRGLEKKVKLYVGQVYDDRDRGFIPGYVRTICEYDAAYSAARRVVSEGGKPLVLMDGSLYLGRFPYTIREYKHHPELLTELFESISRLKEFSREAGFPLLAVAKDSSVFYLYMELLKSALRKAGLTRHAHVIEDASSPLDLRLKADTLEENDRSALEPFIEQRPLCDPPLIQASTETEGYTQPLYLAPSIYYSQREGVPSLYRLIDRNLSRGVSERLKDAINAFFNCPGVALTYWKPTARGRTFRLDVLSSYLGSTEPWEAHTRNSFMREFDRGNLERVLNHVGYWFCNEVEYNVPLKQADTLARFDRDLYRRKYEPFIIKRLEEAGLDVTGTRRVLREMS